MDEILRDLAGVQQEMMELSQLIRSAEEYVPHRAEGFDTSGVITVTIDASGLPDSITVHRG